MPLSPKEKTELESNGRFTREQIRIFETAQVSYDKIKELQDVIQKLFIAEGRQNVTISLINSYILMVLQGMIDRTTGLVNQDSLNSFIIDTQADIAAGLPSSSESEYSDSEASRGGKRRRTRTKRRKSRRSRSRVKKTRRMRRRR